MPGNRRPASPASSARPGGRGGVKTAPASTRPATRATPKVSATRSATGARDRLRRLTGAKRPGGRRPRDRFAAALPEVLTVRTLVFSIVVLLAIVILLPTVRAYVNQTGELRDLRSQLSQSQDQEKSLENQLSRWKDPNFIAGEARKRLNYVKPGDQAWRVLDPGTVTDKLDPQTGKKLTTGPITSHDSGSAWYQSVWDSIKTAGQ